MLVLSFLLLLGQSPAPERTIALEGQTHHVQGIVVEGDTLFLTAVDRANRKGFLFEYSIATGKRVREVEIQDGDRFHPGGFDADATSLWIPVAEYKRNSSAVIQKRNKKTLALEASFPVADHVGCVAVSKNRLYGGNWDSKQIYEWTLDGREIRKRENPSEVHYQDMKYRHGRLVAGGLTATSGFVEFLHPETLRVETRLEFGKTDRGVLYTHEAMDAHDGLLYLLPEDAPSRLFVFKLAVKP